jgi:hypothetical protein
MATTTYSFNTPTPGTEEDTWGPLLNDNFDDLDDLLDGTSQIVSARFTSAAMPADALDPDTGNIQTRTLSANTVFTDALAAGDWLILHLTKGSYTVTWPDVVWVPGDAEPALSTGEEVLSFWKVGSTLYGAWAGPIA